MIIQLEKKYNQIQKTLDVTADMLINGGSRTLLDKLKMLEDEQDIIEYELKKYVDIKNETKLTEEHIRWAIENAREVLISGNGQDVYYLVSEFVERIDVYEDRIDVKIKANPVLSTPRKKKQDSVHNMVK